MIAHFERTIDELVQASIAYATQTPMGRRRVRRQRVVLTAIQTFLGLLLGILLDLLFPGSPWRILAFGVGVGTMQCVMHTLFLRRYVAAEVKRHMKADNLHRMLGPVWMGITPDGLVSRTPDTEVLRKWSAIFAVHDTTDHLLLEVAEGFLAIPRSAFTTEAEAQAFRAALDARGGAGGERGAWYRSKDGVEAQQTVGRRDPS